MATAPIVEGITITPRIGANPGVIAIAITSATTATRTMILAMVNWLRGPAAIRVVLPSRDRPRPRP